MDRLRVVVEDKLNIIHESHDQTRELIVEVGFVFFDELGAG